MITIVYKEEQMIERYCKKVSFNILKSLSFLKQKHTFIQINNAFILIKYKYYGILILKLCKY